MSPRNSDPVAGALAGVRQALAEWDATDLERIERSNGMIQSAIAVLREFQASLQNGQAAQPGNRPALLEIQREATRMCSVVDHCLAFQRGLMLRLGHAAPGYGASGAMIEPAPTAMSGVEA